MGLLKERLAELRGEKEKPTKYDIAIDNINSALESLASAVSEINIDVDLSSVEKSIKKIKPVDLTVLSNKVDNLYTIVQGIKTPEVKDTDLSPIIREISKPKNVEFKVISNSHGFPTKVIATEINDSTIN